MTTPTSPHIVRIFRVGRVHHFPWLHTESESAVVRLYPDGVWRCLGTERRNPDALYAVVLRSVPWHTELRLTLTELAKDLWQFTFTSDHGFEEPQ